PTAPVVTRPVDSSHAQLGGASLAQPELNREVLGNLFTRSSHPGAMTCPETLHFTAHKEPVGIVGLVEELIADLSPRTREHVTFLNAKAEATLRRVQELVRHEISHRGLQDLLGALGH